MFVLWDHESERRELRGAGVTGRLTSSIKALDGAFPPRRWQVMFSGLRRLCFCFFSVMFVMLSLLHISRASPQEF